MAERLHGDSDPTGDGVTLAARTGAHPAADRHAGRVLRFDRVQRGAHWANALLFGIVIATALPLYFSSIERLVGRHVLVEEIHVWAGIALPVPIVVSLLGPWGKRMRRDVRRFNRWTALELRWLWPFGAVRELEKDKYNPGQKLNAVFVGGSIVVMLGTGVIMKWFGIFPVTWRSGATFVHEVLSWIVVIVIAGHVVMAVTHRDALRSMVRGWVTLEWAQRHAPRWAREELGAAAHDAGSTDLTVPSEVP
ncbi:MAG: cytochrome b/b6 domain-containing protein [Acidimicrobiales bacterium]